MCCGLLAVIRCFMFLEYDLLFVVCGVPFVVFLCDVCCLWCGLNNIVCVLLFVVCWYLVFGICGLLFGVWCLRLAVLLFCVCC